MSGKVYTMKEMKVIVAYLVEHKAYGEIRGRKMWVDFANSNLTTRSWQSLKETFLKRILPDIHNPYYNLTREQIISFRQGYDVEEREKNKLEFETVGENSNNIEVHQENLEPILSSEEEVMSEGENDESSNIVTKDIPEQNNCYKTVEDIRRDLESPKPDEEKQTDKSNLNIQSAAVKNVLKDFATDTEDSQDKLAVESQGNKEIVPPQDDNADKIISPPVNGVQHVDSDVIELKSDNDNSIQELSQSKDAEDDTNANQNIPVAESETANKNEVAQENSHDILDDSSTNNNVCEATTNKKSGDQSTFMGSSCQPLTNSTSESLLPNNQEGLKAKTQSICKCDKTEEPKTDNIKVTRKRSSSAETVLLENKRQKRNTTEKQCQPEGNVNDVIYEVNDSDNIEMRYEVIQEDEAEINNEQPVDSDVEEPQTQNPCLKSVSLYAEEFNKTKYSDSSSEDEAKVEEDPKPSGSKEVKKDRKGSKKDVVVLKSHSESESEEEPQVKRRRASNRVPQAQKDKALANVFGFSSGAVSSSRKRRTSQKQRRRSNVHHANDDTESDSSGWTTDTEQDNYVSPPRGRKNRNTRKYLKPKSTRILSLEEEGGLFVMYGKRVYPIVKDGRIVKNFVLYESNSDSGFEQDSYWKAKYAELKKKYEKNKKAKEPSERAQAKKQRSTSREPASPILQSSVRKNPQPAQDIDVPVPSTSNIKPVPENKETMTYPPVENKMASEKITIKYTINNAEVQLEGHWPQICPIFDKVLDVLPKKTEARVETPKDNNKLQAPEQPKPPSSRATTPASINSDSVQDKINKLENEIFKEIEEKDKESQLETEEEDNEQKITETQSNNVTNRKRGRPAKQSTTPELAKSPNKQTKTARTATPTVKRAPESVKKKSVATPVQAMTTRTRKSMKDANVSQQAERTKSTPKQSNVKDVSEDQTRYMFPRTSPQTSSNKKSKSFADRIMFQTEDSSVASESTQDYRDSDKSPVKLKKKRLLRLPTIKYRNKLQSKRNQRKIALPYLLQVVSSDSSNSSFSGQVKHKTTQNSSGVYKSDSYQHLFPQFRKSVSRLEPIHETSPTPDEVEMRPFDAVCRNHLNSDTMESDPMLSGNSEVCSSSNVSLPQSPELSVVEDISIGKEFLNSLAVYHGLKNTPAASAINEEQNEYLITDVDVTMPLMEQMCVLQKSKRKNTNVKKVPNNLKKPKKASVSESLLNKIGTVNINDNSSVADSLDIRLRDLLLESAKKISKRSQSKENMDVDENVLSTIQKSKAKKRCSTPRKKKETIKSKLSNTEATTEHHVEACLRVGRKSCPPSIKEQNEIVAVNSEFNTVTTAAQEVNDKPKGRKKKDVIKVKILRPRNKNSSKENNHKSIQMNSKMSVCTDSGIMGTESGISLPISNVSVELIHNHSETCLHANECLDNSVEFVDASTSLISINSNSMTREWHDGNFFKDSENVSLCSLNNNVTGAIACSNVKCTQTFPNESKEETKNSLINNNEVLNCSLITEDLSDETPVLSRAPSRPSGWYLLSEDETTNTNFVPPPVPKSGGFGSNLNQIFPVTCTIPDLSTITEMSKENDSRKPFGLDSFSTDSNSKNVL